MTQFEATKTQHIEAMEQNLGNVYLDLKGENLKIVGLCDFQLIYFAQYKVILDPFL